MVGGLRGPAEFAIVRPYIVGRLGPFVDREFLRKSIFDSALRLIVSLWAGSGRLAIVFASKRPSLGCTVFQLPCRHGLQLSTTPSHFIMVSCDIARLLCGPGARPIELAGDKFAGESILWVGIFGRQSVSCDRCIASGYGVARAGCHAGDFSSRACPRPFAIERELDCTGRSASLCRRPSILRR